MSNEQTVGDMRRDFVTALTALLRYPGATPDKIMEVVREFLAGCRSEGLDPLTVLDLTGVDKDDSLAGMQQ